MSQNELRALRRLGLGALVAVGSLGLASTAQAAKPTYALPAYTPESVLECVAPALSSPFAGLGDARSYVLAPGGDFSADQGWQLYGGASRTTTDQHDGSEGGVLTLPAGSTAISPYACVDLDYPTARVWSRGDGDSADVDVDVAYPGAQKIGALKGAGKLRSEGPWTASKDLDVRPETAGKVGGWRLVAFVLSAKDKGSAVEVDDLYIDPRMR